MLSLPADNALAVAVVKAIRAGDVSDLGQLLDHNVGLAQARIVDGGGVARTLLHIVADWPGHFPNGPQTVATLLRAGAAVNAAVLHTNAPETALHWAASNDDVGVLDALLDGGADIEAPGAAFTGGAPMSDAVVFGQWRAAHRLLVRGAMTNLWQAAALGLLTAVQIAVTRQPSPTPEQITNACWHGCRGGQLAVVAYLYQQGADLNWVGYNRKAPLDVAQESGNAALVQWLVDHGAQSAQS